jgi:hypothetical protein
MKLYACFDGKIDLENSVFNMYSKKGMSKREKRRIGKIAAESPGQDKLSSRSTSQKN